MNATIFPAIVCSSVATTSTYLIAVCPTDAPTGAQLRSLNLVSSEDIAPDDNNYFLLQVGKLSGGDFKLLGEQYPLSDGFTSGVVRRKTPASPYLVSRGDLVAVRLVPTGSPATIAALSIAAEWGNLSVASPARR